MKQYLQSKYQAALAYGQTYADQMQAENEAHLLDSSSKIYLALSDSEIVGDVTAWTFDNYVEIDDFHVNKDYRGRGIGSMLQREALKGHGKVILIAEEENRAMYEHQGYQEVACYWTALRSASQL